MFCCPVAGYLSIPIATVVKLSLKAPHSENGSDFILSVCRVFSETGRKKVKFIITGRHPGGPAGQANVSRPPEGRLGTLLSKALTSMLAGPCSSTFNCASTSVYFKTVALGKPPVTATLFMEMNVLFHSPWEQLHTPRRLIIAEHLSTPWPQERNLLRVSSATPLAIPPSPFPVLLETVK